MAIKEILTEPNKILRQVSKPVEKVTKEEQSLMDDMLDTMYYANGIGLAATQVDFHKRLIVIDVSEEQNEPLFLVNPEFSVLDETIEQYKEGCLSIPTFYEEIYRPKKIELRFQNLEGKHESVIAEGILSVCVQHEIDHLEGKLMVDYLSPLKRDRIKNKLVKKKDVTNKN